MHTSFQWMHSLNHLSIFIWARNDGCRIFLRLDCHFQLSFRNGIQLNGQQRIGQSTSEPCVSGKHRTNVLLDDNNIRRPFRVVKTLVTLLVNSRVDFLRCFTTHWKHKHQTVQQARFTIAKDRLAIFTDLWLINESNRSQMPRNSRSRTR